MPVIHEGRTVCPKHRPAITDLKRAKLGENLMKLTKLLMATSALSLAAGVVSAQEMTIVSWGGAYSKSQLKAYHEPYSAKTGITIINDDSAAEAVAKLRAMNEAGNVTWDVVDVVAADAIRLCDEGLAM